MYNKLYIDDCSTVTINQKWVLNLRNSKFSGGFKLNRGVKHTEFFAQSSEKLVSHAKHQYNQEVHKIWHTQAAFTFNCCLLIFVC